MDALLAALRAVAEPSRLRLVSLTTNGAFCVVELTEILGQSQPRISRHLRLLCDAGILERVREGANVWFGLRQESKLARDILAYVPSGDAILAADRRAAARVLAERARVATETFRRQGADWDEMRALALPALQVEAAILRLLPVNGADRVLDVGTGTGRMLEMLAPYVQSGLGIDASRAMLALARTRLSQPSLSHLSVRQADMYHLAIEPSFDLVLLHMVLHHAEDPAAVLVEAARVLRPGGCLILVDLVRHDRGEVTERLAHRWPGFDEAQIATWLRRSGLLTGPVVTIDGALAIRLWAATSPETLDVADVPELEIAQ